MDPETRRRRFRALTFINSPSTFLNFPLDIDSLYSYNIVMKTIRQSTAKSTGRVARKPMAIRLTGYEVIEKRADRGGTSGRIYVPKAWIGKLVRAIRIER